MISPVEQCVVQRFLVLYGAPKTMDLEAFVDEYRQALDGTDAGLLKEAINLVRDRHKFPTWPTVGECKDAVQEVAERRAAAAQRWNAHDATAEAARAEPTAESKARVDALMKATFAKLKVSGPPPAKSAPLPDVSRTAWEARFGKPKQDGRRA